MNHNHIRIETIDSWRINEIGANPAGALVSPPSPMISEEPPKVVEQMGPRNAGDFVPSDGVRWVQGNSRGTADAVDLRDPLRVQLDAPVILLSESYHLLNDAKFCSVLPVQEWRNNYEAQLSPALKLLQPGRPRLFSETSAAGGECPARATAKRLKRSPDMG